MDPGFIDHAAFLFCTEHAIKAVNDLDIFVTEIFVVPIDETIIPAGDSIVADAIAGEDIDLHAVICDKEVSAAAADAVGGVVKQIVDIKCQIIIRAKIIKKKILFQIDGSFDVHAIVAEIDERNPLAKSQGDFMSGIIF